MPVAAKIHGVEQRQQRQRLTSREYDKQRGNSAKRGYGSLWRKARLVYLRAHPLCVECQRLGRTTGATDVDHIIPHRGNDQLFWDEINWQSLCESHHSQKTRRENRGRALGMAEVTIVCGAPGSGKTTYVQRHMQDGDLVVDLDAIMSAISGQDWYHASPSLLGFAMAARDAIIDRLTSPTEVRKAWVIASLPHNSEREAMAERLRANVVAMNATAMECKRRIAADSRRDDRDWDGLVDAWFAVAIGTPNHAVRSHS